MKLLVNKSTYFLLQLIETVSIALGLSSPIEGITEYYYLLFD